VLAIQPGRFGRTEKKLRPVGVWACIGHAENARSSVLELEIFIGKLGTINGLSTGTIVIGNCNKSACVQNVCTVQYIPQRKK
jgi:hypothetical protein